MTSLFVNTLAQKQQKLTIYTNLRDIIISWSIEDIFLNLEFFNNGVHAFLHVRGVCMAQLFFGPKWLQFCIKKRGIWVAAEPFTPTIQEIHRDTKVALAGFVEKRIPQMSKVFWILLIHEDSWKGYKPSQTNYKEICINTLIFTTFIAKKHFFHS